MTGDEVWAYDLPGDPPNGTLLFGLVTSGATAAERKVNMNAIYVGVSKSAMATNSGMPRWIRDPILHNPEVLMGDNAFPTGIAYFGWWKRRL